MFNIPTYIKSLSDIFTKNNKELYLVGGCVRDFLLNIIPKDFDVCTNSLPLETVEFLSNEGYKINLRGSKFGVIVAHRKDLPKDGIEIATFRKDISTGRHPEVKVGVSIDDDVSRRDLTINALYINIKDGLLVDSVDGVSDLNNRIIRMVGEPKQRILEDQLRVLRTVRFATRFNFKIEEVTSNSIIEYSDLTDISNERTYDEILKSYNQCDFYKYLKLSDSLGLLNKMFVGLKINTDIRKCNNLSVYISNLLIDNNPKDIDVILTQKLKFDRTTANRIKFLMELSKLDENNVYYLYKQKSILRILDNTILELGKVLDIDFSNFINYNPIHNIDELNKEGFTGKKLGDKITEIETENWRNICQK